MISPTIISEKKDLDLFQNKYCQRAEANSSVLVETQGLFEIVAGEIIVKSPYKQQRSHVCGHGWQASGKGRNSHCALTWKGLT